MPTSNLKKKKSSTNKTSSSIKSTPRVINLRSRMDAPVFSLIQDADNTRVVKTAPVPYIVLQKTGQKTITLESKTRRQEEAEKAKRKGITKKLTPKMRKELKASLEYSKYFEMFLGLGIPNELIPFMLDNHRAFSKFKYMVDVEGVHPEAAFMLSYIYPNGTITATPSGKDVGNTIENWVEMAGARNARNDPNAPWYKRGLDKAAAPWYVESEMKLNPFIGLWNTFGQAGIGAAAVTNPLLFITLLGGYELANNSPKLFGSDKSITDYAARIIPGMTDEFANGLGMLLVGGAKPMYSKIFKPAFNESMLQAGKLGWKRGKIYTANRAINEGIKDFQGYSPAFLKLGILPAFLRYEKGTLDDIENNIRIQELLEPTKRAWKNPSIIGSGNNIPGRPPYGLSRRIRVFDASDPNAVFPLEYVTNTGRTSYGEGNAVELTQQHHHPYTDVSSKVPEGNPEIQELLGAYASMLIDPNMYPSMKHLKLSTTTPTSRNMLLLESMARNLELKPNGVREGFIPWNRLLKLEVPVYGIKSTKAPVLSIEHPQLGVDFANHALSIQDLALRRKYIRRLYPNLSDATIDYMIYLYENSADGTWGKALGFHPLAVENARLTELALKRLVAQDFNPAANGYPDLQVELIGDVIKLLENLPYGGLYMTTFTHPDGSEALITFDNHQHIVRPVLRPSPDTGRVNKSILLPMIREMKKIIENPNLKGWMLGNDYIGSYDPLNLLNHPVGIRTRTFGKNKYSFDSNELMYEFAKKNNLNLYNPVSILDFNDLAFKNRDLSEAFLQAMGADIPVTRKFYYEKFQPYELKIGSPKSVFGSTTGTILGVTPIIGLKKGNKLIRRK